MAAGAPDIATGICRVKVPVLRGILGSIGITTYWTCMSQSDKGSCTGCVLWRYSSEKWAFRMSFSRGWSCHNNRCILWRPEWSHYSGFCHTNFEMNYRKRSHAHTLFPKTSKNLSQQYWMGLTAQLINQWFQRAREYSSLYLNKDPSLSCYRIQSFLILLLVWMSCLRQNHRMFVLR